MTNGESSKQNELKKIYGMTRGELDHLRPYFIGAKAGPQRNRYVLWVDIMGSQGKMLRGLRTASIPLMKLHVAALEAQKKNTHKPINLYPVIDGIYVVCEDLGPLEFFISDVFRSMGAEFIMLEQWERSVIRGAIAYGPVILGGESVEGSGILKESSYAESILLGMPLVQAFVAEKTAPPFGVFVHESVRAFGPTNKHPVTTVLWQWWRKNEENYKIARALLPSLNEYYDWCAIHPISSDYSPDRLSAHRALAHEYLSEFRAELSAEMSKTGPSEASIAQIRARRRPRNLPNERDSASKKPRATDPMGQAKRAKDKLNLDDAQYALLEPIFSERHERTLAAKADASLSPRDRGLKVRSIIEDCDRRIETFLNEDQKSLLRAMHSSRRRLGESTT